MEESRPSCNAAAAVRRGAIVVGCSRSARARRGGGVGRHSPDRRLRLAAPDRARVAEPRQTQCRWRRSSCSQRCSSTRPRRCRSLHLSPPQRARVRAAGHGLVYLAAVLVGRSAASRGRPLIPLVALRRGRGVGCRRAGAARPPRDTLGAVLFVSLAGFALRGKTPGVYAWLRLTARARVLRHAPRHVGLGAARPTGLLRPRTAQRHPGGYAGSTSGRLPHPTRTRCSCAPGWAIAPQACSSGAIVSPKPASCSW